MLRERAADRLRPLEPEPAKPPPLLKPREPGIYFGLSSTAYHADPSLGSSDIKRLLRSPTDYWWQSHLNPERVDDTDSPAKQKGRALHKLVLEGEQAFAAAFIEEPSPDAYPGCLVSADDLKAKCRELGEPVSGTKAELARRLKAKGVREIIFDEVLTTFRVMVERDGLEVLKPQAMREVRDAAASIAHNPHLARAFQGGISEISVFWVEDGIACKCRLDWLKPRTIVDLKSCANVHERPFRVAMRLAIVQYRYDVAAAHYLNGYRYLHRFAAEGRVFGDCPLRPDWGKRILPPDEMGWVWVFHQTQGAPVTEGLELPPGSPCLNRAAREIVQAKAVYRHCMDRFGDSPWISDAPIEELSDSDLPPWMRETVEECV